MNLFVKGLGSGLIGFAVYHLAVAGMAPVYPTAQENDPLLTILLYGAVLGYGLMIGGPVFFWIVVPIARFLVGAGR